MTHIMTIERSITIEAPASDILSFIADLSRWKVWSPWEGQDPNLQRTYTGDPGTVGSTYAWKGNRKAGAGSMLVTKVEPTEVDIDLNFTAPFKSSSSVEYKLVETGGSTRVTWSMTSPQNFMARVMRVVINMDKLIGADFDKGLSQLKTAVETR